MADACAAAGLDVPVLDDATRTALDVYVPSYGTTQNPVDSTAQGVQKLGYAEFARLVARSPSIDGVIVVITARRSAFLEADLPKLKDLAREVAQAGVHVDLHAAVRAHGRDPQRGRLSAVHRRAWLRRARCARWPTTARCVRAFCGGSNITAARAPERAKVGAMLAAHPLCFASTGRGRCSLPMASAPKMPEGSRIRATRPSSAAQAIGRPVALKVQSADIPHKTEAGAVALHLAGADAVGAAYDSVLAAAKRHAPAAHIDGVLVQPMAPPGREVILGIHSRPDLGTVADGRSRRRSGRGAGRCGACARCRSIEATARALIARLKAAHGIRAAIAARRRRNVEALAELMVRLSHFAADHADDIAAIDLNPVIVHAAGRWRLRGGRARSSSAMTILRNAAARPTKRHLREKRHGPVQGYRRGKNRPRGAGRDQTSAE